MFFEKLKNYLCSLYNKYYGVYVPVREFNFKKAQEFYESHKNDLDEMYFCMGFDDEIYAPIIEKGLLVKSPICYDIVDGVKETAFDIPCFAYKFKSGVTGKFYCYNECSYNSKSRTYKYYNPLVLGYMKKPCCGVFDENKFIDVFHLVYGNK